MASLQNGAGMKISTIDVKVVRLPFRFAFKHSLASRDQSLNVIVAVTVSAEGREVTGYGESIPRDYVTGETVDSAVDAIRTRYAPRFINRHFQSLEQAADALQEAFKELDLDKKMMGASWCAFELAVLDACARHAGKSLTQWFGRDPGREAVRYGAVVPFGGSKVFSLVLWFYKLFGFQTIKIKVGKDIDGDLSRLAQARKIVGPDVILRVDANCAWTADEALSAAEKFRKYGVASYEQPTAADDLEGLARVTRSIPEPVLADESLCSVEQARLLAKEKIVSAFNIRISKVGGLFAAREISQIAREHQLRRHMGAQVGESGILSAAGRVFAFSEETFDNYEGSNNFFLLKEDLTRENLNVGLKGFAQLLNGPGLGVNVLPQRLHALEETCQREETKYLVTP